MDDKTGEVFYKAEMLRENYPSGSNEPFNLCWEIVNMIESLQTKEIDSTNQSFYVNLQEMTG